MNNSNTYGGTFFAPDERQISTIGSGYLANSVFGSGTKRAGATLTNKRLYFSGSVYTLNSKGRFVSYIQRKIVNNRDITGAGYVFYRPLHYIWWGIISLFAGFFGSLFIVSASDSEELAGIALWLGIILGITFIVSYFIKRMTLLCIEYAGGNIAFDVRWIEKQEQDDFIRNIHLVKDKLFSRSAADQGFAGDVNDSDLIPEL